MYLSNTDADISRMTSKIGIDSPEELFRGVSTTSALKLERGKSEAGVRAEINAIAAENVIFKSIFRGAGAYDHYIPEIVNGVISNRSLLTAYTPYQPELSQGVLQAIFEYQSMICRLTDMDVSNASHYDGACAAAESVRMCGNRVLTSDCINPQTLEVIRSYGCEVRLIPSRDGAMDLSGVDMTDACCVYLEQPNYFGIVQDAKHIGDIAHKNGCKFIMSAHPISLATLPTPGECGADIAVGEAQPLGMPLSYGGPYLGYMACRSELVRKMPGRIVGRTVDRNGRDAFVLTLQAREQHIRRERALSNICSNQALCALAACVYMASSDLREVSGQCAAKAHYLAARLCAINGFSLVYSGEFWNEFVTTCPIDAGELMRSLERFGILGGLVLDDGNILWCATEKNSKADIDELVRRVCHELDI